MQHTFGTLMCYQLLWSRWATLSPIGTNEINELRASKNHQAVSCVVDLLCDGSILLPSGELKCANCFRVQSNIPVRFMIFGCEAWRSIDHSAHSLLSSTLQEIIWKRVDIWMLHTASTQPMGGFIWLSTNNIRHMCSKSKGGHGHGVC